MWKANFQTNIFVLLLTASLAARIILTILMGLNGPMVSDEQQYFYPAYYLAAGKGLQKAPQGAPAASTPRPTAYRVPVPSIILAAVFTFFGKSIFVGRIACLVLGCFAAPLMFLFAKRIVSTHASILAGICVALWPTWLARAPIMGSEHFFIPFLLLSLLFTINVTETPGKASQVTIAGICWGVTALCRPHALPMVLMIAVFLVWRISWKRGLILGGSAMMTILPWLIRNQLVIGHPVLLALEGGETFLGSNNHYVVEDPDLYGVWLAPMLVPEYRRALQPFQDEFSRDREQYRLGVSYLKSNPEQIPKLAFYKLWRWLTPVTKTPGIARVAVILSYGSLLLLLIGGILCGVISSKSTPFPLIVICSTVLLIVTVIYWGGLTLGRLPLEFLWLPWGTASFLWIKTRLFQPEMKARVVSKELRAK